MKMFLERKNIWVWNPENRYWTLNTNKQFLFFFGEFCGSMSWNSSKLWYVLVPEKLSYLPKIFSPWVANPTPQFPLEGPEKDIFHEFLRMYISVSKQLILI